MTSQRSCVWLCEQSLPVMQLWTTSWAPLCTHVLPHHMSIYCNVLALTCTVPASALTCLQIDVASEAICTLHCRLAAKQVDEGGSAAPPPPSGSIPAGHDDGLGPILPDFGSLLHADKPDARRYNACCRCDTIC